MSGREPDSQELDRRELDLTLREADLNRRESHLLRVVEERTAELDARETQLNRRETSVVLLAGELAAERDRLNALRTRVREDLKSREQRGRGAAPRTLQIVGSPEPPDDGGPIE